MINRSVLIVLSGLLVLIIGCNNKDMKPLKNQNEIVNSNNSTERIKYTVDFPDTVYLNKEYFGLINYQSSLDSITPKFGIKGENRYVRLILTSTENIDYDLKHLKTMVKDTFGAYDNKTIDFLLKFDKRGVFYIDGVINDVVLIDLPKKNENEDELVRWIEDEVRVTKKVVVIDKK